MNAADRFFRFLRGIALTLLMCACASPVPQRGASLPAHVENFAMEGRFSLRNEARNYYGRLDWRHTGMSELIFLSSSFGQGMAEMTVNERGARLVLSDGAVHEADRAEALMHQLLGYPFSISRLAGWIAGRAERNKADADWDALGRLRRLRHEGWIVDYAYGDDAPDARPARIVAMRSEGNIELRLKIDAWGNGAAALPASREVAVP